MALVDWLRKLFGRQEDRKNLVAFYDVPSRRVVHIPPQELAPGVVRAKVDGIDKPVWILPDQLQPGPLQQPAFSEEIREYVRRIQETFAEHRPLSVEEWEDGFRRDRNPAQEIALWLHAADVYFAFAKAEAQTDRRKHLYQVIVACLTTTPETVRHVIPNGSLSGEQVDAVVRRFYH